MRRFGTEGRLYLEDNYVVPRTEETVDFIERVKQGKYIVLFAPRQAGKQQLATYLKSEGVLEGYYVIFDHRASAESRIETDTLAGNLTIRSYVIPVIQEVPSSITANINEKI